VVGGALKDGTVIINIGHTDPDVGGSRQGGISRVHGDQGERVLARMFTVKSIVNSRFGYLCSAANTPGCDADSSRYSHVTDRQCHVLEATRRPATYLAAASCVASTSASGLSKVGGLSSRFLVPSQVVNGRRPK